MAHIRGPRPWQPGATAALFIATFLSLGALALGASSPPTISITAPTAGSTVKGTVAITATATAASGDTMYSVSFYDGANRIGGANCNNQASCNPTYNWDATGLSGTHTLTAVANANSGGSTTSAPVTVTIVSPPPMVSITSPAAGAKVAGNVTVTASAATDPSQTDYPTQIYFHDGVKSLGSINCQGQTTCQGSVTWAATGLTGSHTLTAAVQTNKGLSETSSPAVVTVLSPGPSVRIVSPGTGAPLGRKLTVRVSGQTDPSQVDYPTSITVHDGTQSIGQVNCQGQQKCAGNITWDARTLSGEHRLTAVIQTNTGRSATSPAVEVGVAVRLKITPSCTLSSSSVGVGQPVRGRCTVPGAPTGTYIAIQYSSNGRWVTVLSGKVSRGHFSFTLRGHKRATADFWVFVGGTSRTLPARANIGTLKVR